MAKTDSPIPADLPGDLQEIVIERREVIERIPIAYDDAGFGVRPVPAAFDSIGKHFDQNPGAAMNVEFSWDGMTYQVQSVSNA